jgi:hypothetical protein
MTLIPQVETGELNILFRVEPTDLALGPTRVTRLFATHRPRCCYYYVGYDYYDY